MGISAPLAVVTSSPRYDATSAGPVAQLVGGAGEHDLSGHHHARARAQPERHRGVLLDEQDRRALAISCSAAKSVFVTIGASPSDGSSSSSSRGPATSARPIATICCSPPESAHPSRLRSGTSAGKSS